MAHLGDHSWWGRGGLVGSEKPDAWEEAILKAISDHAQLPDLDPDALRVAIDALIERDLGEEVVGYWHRESMSPSSDPLEWCVARLTQIGAVEGRLTVGRAERIARAVYVTVEDAVVGVGTRFRLEMSEAMQDLARRIDQDLLLGHEITLGQFRGMLEEIVNE